MFGPDQALARLDREDDLDVDLRIGVGHEPSLDAIGPAASAKAEPNAHRETATRMRRLRPRARPGASGSPDTPRARDCAAKPRRCGGHERACQPDLRVAKPQRGDLLIEPEPSTHTSFCFCCFVFPPGKNKTTKTKTLSLGRRSCYKQVTPTGVWADVWLPTTHAGSRAGSGSAGVATNAGKVLYDSRPRPSPPMVERGKGALRGCFENGSATVSVAVSSTVSVRLGEERRGGTPTKPAGEDACATFPKAALRGQKGTAQPTPCPSAQDSTFS